MLMLAQYSRLGACRVYPSGTKLATDNLLESLLCNVTMRGERWTEGSGVG